ncbi:hypothetical protein PR202_gb07732 [Eleusine coracana subsp. coracana]|uniref:Cytochrome P450 n=1 Tax=Eleusine coracana subsp. coracana TaxID=191504 RepID=A0AAV5ECX6_ELECO|nr:hypothetical protein PR202_gb07732 [Eleusine coracana subsp. coracana]
MGDPSWGSLDPEDLVVPYAKAVVASRRDPAHCPSSAASTCWATSAPLPRPPRQNLRAAHVPPSRLRHHGGGLSEAAREILQRHDAVFSNRSVPDAPGKHTKHSSVWLPNAPQWRALQKLMGTELFSPHRLDALQHLRLAMVQELIDHVGRLARDGQAVNVGRVAFITSLNLVLCTIFSRDLTNLDDDGKSREFQEVVTAIMEAVGSPNIWDFFPAIAAADLQGWRRRLARLFARLHKIFDQEIDQRQRDRQAGEPRKNDFLDPLLDAAARDDTTARLDRDTLRSMFTVSRFF